jgi:ribonuclease R
MEQDFFVFDPSRSQLVGRRTRRVIRLGDQMQVQVEKVDAYKRQVDFRVVSFGQAGVTPPPARGRKPDREQPRTKEQRHGRPPGGEKQGSKPHRGQRAGRGRFR